MGDLPNEGDIEILIKDLQTGNIAKVTEVSHLKIDHAYVTYAASYIGSAVGANKYHANLFNASGSGKLVKVLRVELQPQLTGLITGHSITFRALRSSTTGTGTTGTIAKLDTNDGDVPAQVTVRGSLTAAPTVSDVLALGIVDTEESRPGQKCIVFDSRDGVGPIVLREGQGLAIQQDAYASGGNISVIYYFTLV